MPDKRASLTDTGTPHQPSLLSQPPAAILRIMRSLLFLLGSAALAQTTVRFDPRSPDVGPFPTDFLTTADAAQKTGLRVNLPGPDGLLVNDLDGFNLQPRISVRFSSRVNVDTLRSGIFYVALENLTDEEFGVHKTGDVDPINEVIYDPATNTAFAKPDSAMDQHRRYAIVVTDAIRDAAGSPVRADAGFQSCIDSPPDAYCAALSRAVGLAAPKFAPARIVGGSVFTTLSATAWLEKARAQVQNVAPSVAPAVSNNVFKLSDLSTLTLRTQVATNPARFDEFTLPVNLVQGIGSIAFFTYNSPNFLNSSQIIPPVPTGFDLDTAPTSQVHFHALLPSSAKPASGYPVMIFGHGLTDSSFGGPSAMATVLGTAGFAVVAINAVGHGGGPLGTVVLRDRAGNTTEVPAGGRSIDLNGDGAIDSEEGCIVVSPPVAVRDCLRQTVVDLAQLVHAIQLGVDVDGDGVPDLDANRIYYAGQSLGALYGTMLSAVEPNVRASALNAGGGSVVDIARWSPAFRDVASAFFGGQMLNDNYVLRYQPVKVNDVPGAIAVQNTLERFEWLQAAGDPLSFAPHFASSTLPGVPIKPILFQFAKGDRTVPNPTSTALIRAANMREHTWFYRHDLARKVAASLPENPHTFLLNLFSLPALPIAGAAQSQIAAFFASDGAVYQDPNAAIRGLYGADLFEVPGFLTEDLNW